MNIFNNFTFRMMASVVLITAMINCTPKVGGKMDRATEQSSNTENPNGQSVSDNFRSQVPKGGPAPIIKIGKSEEFSLPNGLKVILVENHKLPVVSYQVLMDEEAWTEGEKSGVGNIAGDLLTRGTTSRSKAQIDEAVDFIGARINSGATSLSGSALTKHTDKFLEVFSDVLMNPVFPKSEFEKIVKETSSGLASSKEDANEISRNVASVINYGKDHPYGEILTEKTLENIRVEDCKSFYKYYWNPSNAFLVMVGDLNLEEAKKIANEYFAGWKSKPLNKAVTFSQPEIPIARTIDFVNKAGAVQSVIRMTYPLDMPMGAEDRTATSVMNSILGGYFQSRINQNLRETHAYTYGARSSISSDPLIGNFTASTSVRNEVTDSAIYELIYEVNKLRTELVDDKELEMVKNVLAGSFGRRLERASTVATFALNKKRYGFPDDYYDTYLDKLSKVTAEDVLDAAQKYLKPDNAHFIVVGSKSDVAEKLKQFAPDGKVNFYNTYGEKIEIPDEPISISPDEIISNYLTALGGVELLEKVNSVKQVLSTSFQGMTMTMINHVTNKGQFRSEMSMGEQAVQTQIYNNGKVGLQAMGQDMPADEAMVEDFKYSAYPVPEMMYKEWGVKGAIEGVEEINDELAYVVKWQAGSGKTWTEYYSKETGLKTRIVNQSDANGTTVTQTMNMLDYKPVNGIRFAHKTTISGGGMPMVLEMKLDSVETNIEIDPTLFEIK